MKKLSKLFAHIGWVCIPALATMLACQSSPKKDTETAHATSSYPDTTQPVNNTDSIGLQDRSVKFLWREDQVMEEYDATVSTIVLDEAYVDRISDPEKAALGYVATFIGNECAWDGKATASRSNLKCKILTALNLGYQCSDTHLGFLRKWFRDDSTVLKKLESCPTIPDGATSQETFDRIDVTVADGKIAIAYEVTGINTREGKQWTWKATDLFIYQNNGLKLVKAEKSDPVITDFEWDVP